MSRSDTLRSEIARLESSEASLRKTVAAQEKAAGAARAAAAKKRASAKSATTIRSATRAAEAEDKKVAAAEKKLADAKGKLASNTKSQATKRSSLAAAEKAEQKSADRAADKRRSTEKSHAREIARIGRGGPGSGGGSAGQTMRYVTVRPPEPERLRVLYLTSNPEATETETIAPDGTVTRKGTWLRTEAEVRGVQQVLRGSKYRDLVELSHRPAASPRDLLDAINDVRPHVIHFSGHGWSQGLVMDNGIVDEPAAAEIHFELLVKLLAATTTPPTLLVLNACETLGGADLLFPAVPVVIGMSDTIADVAASVFAGQFYAAIASAQSVGVALGQAKVAMEIAQLEDAELPEAICRDDIDINDLVLVRPPRR